MSSLLQPAYPRTVVDGPGPRRFRLEDGRPVASGGAAPVRDMVAVPAEEVTLLAVALPAAAPRLRREALPYAVEDLVAEPLEALHIAMGADLGEGRVLAAIVRHRVMEAWQAGLVAAGLEGAALVPDCLLVPRPADPAGWTVRVEDGRALVRTGDGAGFAIAADQLAAAWIAGGRPMVEAAGGDLPADIPAVAGIPLGEEAGPPPVDLAQGRYAVRRRAGHTLWRRAATVAALGLAAHALIAVADTALLARIAVREEAATRALVAPVLPAAADGDVVALAGDRLAGIAPSTAAPDRLLPLLARVATALRPAGPVAVQALRADPAAGRLLLTVDPADAARVAGALTAGGLTAAAAGGDVTVRDRAS